MQVKVNVRRHTMDKINRPTTSIMGNGINNAVSIEDFRLYITTLEGLLKDTLNENLKLKQQLNEFIPKKTQYDLKKVQTKVEENIKRYSRGKIFLNELEKKIQLKPINQIMLKDPNKISNPINPNNQKIIILKCQTKNQNQSPKCKKPGLKP